MSSILRITHSRSGDVFVLGLTGRIDSTNAQDVMELLQQAIAMGEKAILLDLAAVRYLTSAAFRVLLVATEEAESRSVRFALCNVIGQVRNLFEMSGLLDAFTVHGSRDEGVTRLS
jgi:anti-sigma B factor antagonist